MDRVHHPGYVMAACYIYGECGHCGLPMTHYLVKPDPNRALWSEKSVLHMATFLDVAVTPDKQTESTMV